MHCMRFMALHRVAVVAVVGNCGAKEKCVKACVCKKKIWIIAQGLQFLVNFEEIEYF